MIDISKIDGKISDELLAAYIDGNTTEEENIYIKNEIESNDYISEAFDIISGSNVLENYDWDIHKGDFGFWELGLPPVIKSGDINGDNYNDMQDPLGNNWGVSTPMVSTNEYDNTIDSNPNETIPLVDNNDNFE